MAEPTDTPPDIPPLAVYHHQPPHHNHSAAHAPQRATPLTPAARGRSSVKTPSGIYHSTIRLALSTLIALLLLFGSTLPTSASALPPARQYHNNDAFQQVSPSSARHVSQYEHDASDLISLPPSLGAYVKEFSLRPNHFTLLSILDRSSYSAHSQGDALDLIEQLIALKKRDDATPTTASSSQAGVQRRALWSRQVSASSSSPAYAGASDTDKGLSAGAKAGYAIVVPILVILSGIFAGLTLGYMSLDETQLQVLATTGSEKQKACAKKIIPIRKDGHLLLTTLLIANMITNETLPIVADPLFPSPVLAVVVSTVLVIIFSELVPQSVCSRYGLEIGAYMAMPARCIIFILWPISYPVSRVLHWTLGPHHGIVYRRAELKELVIMHALSGGRGGDLNGDTVMMVGGALDLQEKVAQQAMTSIDNVFMLPYEARLDYATLERVVRSGHSRIPIYQEVEVPVNASTGSGSNTPGRRAIPAFLSALTRKSTMNNIKDPNMSEEQQVTLQNSEKSEQRLFSTDKGSGNIPSRAPSCGTAVVKRKKIIGTLLVKSCVLLDPEDAVLVSEMTINALPSVPHDEPLLNVLNAFQDGRSHMAIVTSASRLNDALVMNKSSSNAGVASRGPALSGIDEERTADGTSHTISRHSTSSSSSNTGGEYRNKFRDFWKRRVGNDHADAEKQSSSQAPLAGRASNVDAEKAFPDIIGVITLEDVLEELIGEEIYDEYDPREDGGDGWNKLTPPSSPEEVTSAMTLVSGDSNGTNGRRIPSSGVEGEISAGTSTDSPLSSLAPEEDANIATPRSLFGRFGILAPHQKGSSVANQKNHKNVLVSSPTGTEDNAQGSSTPPPTMSEDPHRGSDYLSARSATPDLSTTPKDAVQSPLCQSAPNAAHDTVRPGLLSSDGPSTTVQSSLRPSVAAGGTFGQHPLSRPIVVRTQLPGGGKQTAIVGEHLLMRGRGLTSGSGTGPGGGGVVGGSNSGGLLLNTGSTSVEGASRSSTPKPNRFKSAPVHPQGGTTSTSSSGGGPVRALSRDDTARREKVDDEQEGLGSAAIGEEGLKEVDKSEKT